MSKGASYVPDQANNPHLLEAFRKEWRCGRHINALDRAKKCHSVFVTILSYACLYRAKRANMSYVVFMKFLFVFYVFIHSKNIN
jgi:hypothetical protein